MTKVTGDLLTAALEWAEAGVPVFPVTMPSKRPITPNGHLDASTDPQVITAMFASNGATGIGAAMGFGMFALDADTYKPGEAGESARAYVAALEGAGLLPATRTHRTVSGGVHYLYASEDCPNVNPAAGVEVKGRGGYIVVPPTDGYVVDHEGIADAPAGLIAKLRDAKRTASMTTIEQLEQGILTGKDFHESIAKLSAKLAAAGQEPNDVLARINSLLAASVASNEKHPRHARWLGLVEDKGGELTRTVTGSHKYNPDAPEKRLREFARANGLFGRGGLAEGSVAASEARSASETSPTTFPFVGGYFGHEQLKILDQTFVAYPLLADGETMVISAKPKAGKTLLAQTLGMHIAAGADLGEISIPESRPVIYFSLEGQITVRRRMMAWKQSVDPDGDKLTEETFPFYVYERPINLLKEEVRNAVADNIVAADAYWKAQGFASLGAAIIDTLTKAMPGGKQNDVEDTSLVFDLIGRVRERGCSVPIIFIHHDSKAGDVRGSSNIQAEPDTLLGVEADPDNDRIDLVVRMARNMEGVDRWAFRPVSILLGQSAQGFDIKAPVAVPVSLKEEEAAMHAAVEADLVEASNNAKVLRTISALGVGMKTVRFVHEYLAKTLPGDVYPVADRRYTAKEVHNYLMTIVPKTGIAVEDHHITMNSSVSRHGRREVVKLESITVRALTQSVAL